MTKNNQVIDETTIKRFLDRRVADGKMTREDADAILAKHNADLTRFSKKAQDYQGRNISSFTAAEQKGLLIILAYVCGIADANGVIL
jgi:hypothetical protein